MINLIELYSGNTDKIVIDGDFDIPFDYLNNSDIFDLSCVSVKGEITKIEDEYYISFNANGKMKISDSITLKEIWYPFSIDFNEKLDDFVENDKNSLDIIELLWQNIVLEVPLRYTEVSDFSKYQGDGWKLVSEEDFVNNNPFNTLLEDEDWSD